MASLQSKIVINAAYAPFTILPAIDDAAQEFHQRLPGYAPSALRSAPGLAAVLQVGTVWIKDESCRMDLPAYKILGASWATYRALELKFGPFPAWRDLADLQAYLRPHQPLTLVAATDGNHGRAVARMARWLGMQARIYVPADMAPAREMAIESEGAKVVKVHGSYDDAVMEAARQQASDCLVIADTGWEGYDQVPQWVVDGYATIFGEIDAQLLAAHAPAPDLVLVQIGVGALAAATIRHFVPFGTRVIGVEPSSAACVLASIEAGAVREVPGPHPSIMAGLNCGIPSPVAWPTVSRGLTAAIGIGDGWAEEAMCMLAAEGIISGESGAAGVGGALAALAGKAGCALREELGLTAKSTLLFISTEGATDPVQYAAIVARKTAAGMHP